MWKPKVICAYIGIIFFAFCLSVGIGEAVTAATENAPISRGTVYILDAGHGGEDGGAISCTGAKESDINLQITLRLNDVFHLLGRETRLIRETDVSVYTSGNTIAAKKVSDLKHRVSIVNETADAVLVSIHQNTFPESKYYGPQVFYNGKGSSETLAKKLQVSLNASLFPQSKRLSKPGEGIYLLEKIDAPGILVECGFLSNEREEALLRDREYQKKLCCVIATGILSLDPGRQS